MFIREWRQYRSMSLDKLGGEIGVSKGVLSEIERGKRRYNQDQLEAIAKVLRCTPGDLLDRDPNENKTAEIVDIWDHIPTGRRDQAIEVLKTFTKPAS